MKRFLPIFCCIGALAACQPKSDAETASTTTQPVRQRVAKNATEERIYQSADSMTNALMKRDWSTFAQFINPTMLRLMGGEGNMTMLIQQQTMDVPDSLIKEVRVERILQVDTTGNEMHCLAEQVMITQSKGHQITNTTYLIGLSLNGGNSWTFFDASNNGRIKAQEIIPNLDTSLIIPERKQTTTAL